MTLYITRRLLLVLFAISICMKPRCCRALQVQLRPCCRPRRYTAADLRPSVLPYYAATRETPCALSCVTTVLFSTKSGNADETLKTLAPGAFYMAELEVKKSRFLGYASHARTWDDAKSYIEHVKSEHPKARHWCYGYCGGYNPVNERCSDDGEPSGTAGAPILNALRGEGMSDSVCVVVRYFGGIKLGAGGLIRAYGAAARQVLREASVEIIVPTTSIQVTVGPNTLEPCTS